jgi:hypothetical protein
MIRGLRGDHQAEMSTAVFGMVSSDEVESTAE